MTDKKILEEMKKMLAANNTVLLEAVDVRIEASEKRLGLEIKSAKEELTTKIKSAQQDTIETLTDVIHTGYNLHDARIERLEKNAGLPPLKQN